MKIFLLCVIMVACAFAGYQVGLNSYNAKTTSEVEVEEVPATVPEKAQVNKDTKLKPIVSQELQKKKTSLKEQRIEFEKRLNTYMYQAPYSLVQSIFENRSNEIRKAAFGEQYDKGEWDSETRKVINQAVLEASIPIMKKSFYYSAQGVLILYGREVPYDIALTFSKYPYDKVGNSTIPKKVDDLNTFVSVKFDISYFSEERPTFIMGTGGGVHSVSTDGNRYFFQVDNYDPNLNQFSNILYFLIEMPNLDEGFSEIRFFDAQVSKWITASQQLQWRAITLKEYREFETRSFDD